LVAHNLRFRRLDGKFAVCRLPPNSSIPPWLTLGGRFVSITHIEDELSIVCLLENVPEQYRGEIQWTCFKLEGPFPFSAVGVLHSFIAPLAQAEIPIFAVSTYDTDYVLVKDTNAERATEALRRAGYQLIP
jgi:hypothetical protein